MFSGMAMTNSEVAGILRELCEPIERFSSQETTEDRPATRRSIVDPHRMKTMGPRTTSTSARVDGSARLQRTRMVDNFQVNVLDRTKKPSKQKRRHTCSICRSEGHHSQTCQHILASENTDRANLFFKQLIGKGNVRGFLDLLAKRHSHEFVNEVTERIEGLKARSSGEKGK